MATLYADLADTRLAEILAAELMFSRADRNALINHPALRYVGDLTATGSATVKQSDLTFMGADLLAAVLDGATVAETVITDASYNVTISRRAKRYIPSDLARVTDSYGHLDPTMFAQDATLSAGLTLTSLVAGLMGGFSNVFGTSGSNLTIQDFEDAVTNLEINNVEGPYMAILHGRQWGDLRDSIRTATGTVAFDPASPEMIRMRGTGFKGSIYGVDLFVSNYVNTVNAGADRAGGIFGNGAVLWADASIPQNPSITGINAGKVLMEMERNAAAATTDFVTSYFLGVSEGDDSRGSALISDA